MLVHRFWGQLCAADYRPNLARRTTPLLWRPDNVHADLELAKGALAHLEQPIKFCQRVVPLARAAAEQIATCDTKALTPAGMASLPTA